MSGRPGVRWLVDLAARVAFPLFVFWRWTIELELADWGAGVERALLCAGGLVGVGLLARLRPPALPRGAAVVLGLAAVALAAVHVGAATASARSGRGPTIDIGQTTIRAVELAGDGRNPYAEKIDAIGGRVDPRGTGFRFFQGFKYGPAMRLAYTPGVRAAGNAGFFVTSLVALLLCAGLGGAWASAAGGGAAAGWGAAALVLCASFIDHELFSGGINDVVPVALALGAFALRARGLAVAAGVLIGASFGAKLFPAAIYALPLCAMGGRRWRFVAAAAAAATAIYLPALIASPRELVAGLLAFNFARPADTTSALFRLPGWLASIVGAITLAAAIALAFRWGRGARDRAPAAAATVASACVVLLFVGSRMVHRNYLFWLCPTMAVAVASRLWRREGEGGAAPAADRAP